MSVWVAAPMRAMQIRLCCGRNWGGGGFGRTGEARGLREALVKTRAAVSVPPWWGPASSVKAYVSFGAANPPASAAAASQSHCCSPEKNTANSQ